MYLKAAGSYDSAKASERDYLTCDENGFAQTKDMPYGIYTVHQVSGWEGSEQMPDFDVFISQNGATYRYLINNAPFNSFIKIVKQDAETGKTIPYAGAGFKIYDPDGNPVTMTFTYPTPTTIDVFYTNAEGSLVTPEKLSFGKGYSIVEVQAPYGYVLDETPVYFDVTEDNSTEESGVTVVKVDKPNMAQKGTITVEKTGEVFFGVSVIGGVDESGNELSTIYQPQYEKRGLPGAVYEIIAAEDIITQDGTVRNQKGEVVDTVTTDATGAAVSRELYLGKYEVREITAPHGMVLNPEPHCVELVYKDSNANGKLDDSDELLGTLTEKEIGEYGMNDLFYGRYFVKETKAPEGFVLDTGVYEVMIDTDGKTYEVENKAGIGFINDAMRGNLKIIKTSSDGKVKGFAFRITGANGYDIILETNDKGEIFIDGLRIGDYTISEVSNSASSMYVIPAGKKATVKLGSTTIVEMHNVLRDTPKTGDTTNLPLLYALAGLSAAGIAVCGVIGFKKKKKEDRN